MEIKSYSKYMRISPKKAREVARILPGKKATEGVSILKFIPRKAARLFGKTLTLGHGQCREQFQFERR